MPHYSRVLEGAWTTVGKNKSSEVRHVGAELIRRAEQKLEQLNEEGLELRLLPAFCASNNEDGSALLEWIFEDMRLGFNLEEDREDSGWHLVTSKRFCSFSSSGTLLDEDFYESQLHFIIEFAVIWSSRWNTRR